MNKTLRLLIVEDSEDDVVLLLRELNRGGYEVRYERVETSGDLQSALSRETWQVIISDYIMPRFSGLEALKLVRETSLDIPFIILSGKIGEDTAVEAMKAGASDYIVKGNLVRLIPAIERELREVEMRRDRARTEEALRVSEEKLGAVAAAATDAIIMTDDHGNISYWNPAAARIFLHSEEEVKGRPFVSLVPVRLRKPLAKGFERFLKSGHAPSDGDTLELIALRKDGKEFPVEASLSRVVIGDKRIAAAIVRDITDRKRIQEELETHRNNLEDLVSERTSELKKTNELLEQEIADRKLAEESLWAAIAKVEEEKAKSEAIIAALGDGVMIVDRQFRILYQNKLHQDIFGNHLGRYCYKSYFEGDRVCADCPVGKSFRTGMIHKGEKDAPSARGLLNVEITASPLRDHSGQIVAGIALVRDVTERKRMEDELREHRDHLDLMVRERTTELRKVNKELRAEIMRRIQMEKDLIESQRFVHRITDATPNLLYLYDAVERQTVYINPRVKEILGYSPSEVKRMGSGFYDRILHPDDSSAFKSLDERFSMPKEGDIVENEYRLRNRKGEWRWFSGRDVIFKMSPDNRISLILGAAQDITEKKAADEKLKESREQLRQLLAHVQSVREEERTRISREIHDELGQSLTALKMDLAWLIKRMDGQKAALVEKATSMSHLIDTNIQTVKRIASELRPGLLDVLGLTSALEWQARQFQERTGIRCRVSVHPEDMSLERDLSTAIFRIFQETLTNVARHAGAKKVAVKLQRKKETLLLHVQDDGKGISEKQITSPASIGLIGMRERVHYFGGALEITGVRNKGTTITVRIPLNGEADRPARKGRRPSGHQVL